MRSVTSFTVPEARIFRELESRWGRGLAVVVSKDEQPDLYRIFDVLEPQGIRGIFLAEEDARTALLSPVQAP
jgi:hypothetical protein